MCAVCFSYRPTFRRIIRNKSTEQFSGLPYIYALLNCLICLWYGMPIVSSGIILIATVNSIGAVFQLVYVIIYVVYADQRRRVNSIRPCLNLFVTRKLIIHHLTWKNYCVLQLNMLGLLLGVFVVFVVIAFVSLRVFEPPNRQLFVGYLSVFSLISMFASPLFVIVSSLYTHIDKLSSDFLPC